MNNQFREKSMDYLRFQRNVFTALTLLLSTSAILLSTFLFLKSERIIISPPVVEKEFWLDSKHVSPTYLEQMGSFLGQLLLSKSPQSAAQQKAILLRHAAPQFAASLRQKLTEEETRLHTQGASYTFFPITIHAAAEKLQVLLQGDRVLYASGKQVSCERQSYTLSFYYTGSRLLLSAITGGTPCDS